MPLIIHLLNRRKAKVVEWGAMRFLVGSLVSRRRRIQIEEMILLALRCLLMALLALAVARPFTPGESSTAPTAIRRVTSRNGTVFDGPPWRTETGTTQR